jgi:uncharacterized protein (TIGR00290 family)
MKVFCSWSGGKDSCLSYHKAILEGHEVVYLLTMFSTTGKYTHSHRLTKDLILAQSQAVGIPVYHRRASWNTYEGEFKRALAFLKGEDTQGGVFGNLWMNEHREWAERVCTESGIMPLLPLWKMEGKDLLWQLVGAGFEAVVIGVKHGLLDIDWLGRRIDEEFINEMGRQEADLCGEQGEYHTLVVDGPIFGKRITIGGTRVIRRKEISFLEILNFDLEDK